jgi:hypothetical protein
VKEPSSPTQLGGEQETGVIPFNTEMISPIVLSQPYEGGSEGDNEIPGQSNDEDNNDESADEEEEENTQNEETADT